MAQGKAQPIPIDKPAFGDALMWMCFNRRVGMVIETNDVRIKARSKSGSDTKAGHKGPIAGAAAARVAALSHGEPPASRGGNTASPLGETTGKEILAKLRKERAPKMAAGEAMAAMALLNGNAWGAQQEPELGEKTPTESENGLDSAYAPRTQVPRLPLENINQVPEPTVVEPRVVFVYGSQTGTGQEIARKLNAEAVERGLRADVMSWNELGLEQLSPAKTPILVVVQSSTGDGEAPDNSSHVFTAMQGQQPATLLSGVQFTMLGLGDSGYNTYMAAPRWLKSRLEDMGASLFYPDAEADDSEGTEVKATPWADGLWEPLTEAYMGLKGSIMSPRSAGSTAAKKQLKGRAAMEASGLLQSTRLVQGPDGRMIAVPMEHEGGAPSTPGRDAVLAQMRAKGNKNGATQMGLATRPKVVPPVVIAYASQTGKGESIAQELLNHARGLDIKAELKTLDELRFAALNKQQTPIVIIVSSSTGSGRAPDNGREMVRALKAEHPEGCLEGVNFTLLGLGDSTYDSYMAVPRLLWSRLTELGAHMFHPFVEADEQKGQAHKARIWSDGLWGKLENLMIEVSNAPETSSLTMTPSELELESAVRDSPQKGKSKTEDGVSARKSLDTAHLMTVDEDAVLEAGATSGREAGSGDGTGQGKSLDRSSSNSSHASASGAKGSGKSGAKSARGSSNGAKPSTPQSSSRSSVPGTPLGSGRQDKMPGRLQGKPTSVNFPKREDTVVPVRPDADLGLQLGLAPVGVDLKGALAQIPCRIKVATEKDAKAIAAVKKKEAVRPSPTAQQFRDPNGMYSKENPYWAKVADARYETAFWSDRKVLHVEIDLGDSDIKYEPGDSIGVMPSNPPEMVNNLLKRLNRNADDVITIKSGENSKLLDHIPRPCTLGYALTHCVDLTSATPKSLLRMLADHCSDPSHKRTLMYFTSKAGGEAYKHEIQEHQPNLLDLLVRFKTCSPPLDALLDVLPPMAPRYYSICSAPTSSPTRVQVAMSVVRFKTKYGNRMGVATTWLDRMAQPFSSDGTTPSAPLQVPIFLHRSPNFRPPSDLATPMIMVGPGTGVSPFRGFLQARQHLIKTMYPDGLPKELPADVGASWLFCGCRREDEDFLYNEDLTAFEADRTVTVLKTAFSRAQAEKVYVQHLIKENGAALAELIESGAVIYVCGDGANMAKDVDAAIQSAIAVHNNISEQEAATRLSEMSKTQRYIKEVWS